MNPDKQPQQRGCVPSWTDPNCGACGGSGYTSLGGCYVCQKQAAERQQRGCRECGELDYHAMSCSLFHGRKSRVLDTEREAESQQGEVPETIWLRGPDEPFNFSQRPYTTVRVDPRDIEYRRVETCEWSAGRNKGDWDSECNQGWWFEDGDPEDHGWKQCPFCGGQLEVK